VEKEDALEKIKDAEENQENIPEENKIELFLFRRIKIITIKFNNNSKPKMKTAQVYIPKINETITYSIGTNAQDNFDIIDAAEETDLWFHVDNQPSCHVVASIPNAEKYNHKEIAYIAKQGACICKQYSKYASQKKLPIIYSKIIDITKSPTQIGTVMTNGNAKIIYI
jgi:predicted ribosome quality control (RQC) complex YloA/Tae2 family protein